MALGVPVVRAGLRLTGQVEPVGLLQRPVGKVDEIRRAIGEEGVDVLVPTDVGVAVDNGEAVLLGKLSERCQDGGRGRERRHTCGSQFL